MGLIGSMFQLKILPTMIQKMPPVVGSNLHKTIQYETLQTFGYLSK